MTWMPLPDPPKTTKDATPWRGMRAGDARKAPLDVTGGGPRVGEKVIVSVGGQVYHGTIVKTFPSDVRELKEVAAYRRAAGLAKPSPESIPICNVEISGFAHGGPVRYDVCYYKEDPKVIPPCPGVCWPANTADDTEKP